MDKSLIERAIDSAKHRQYKLSADLKRDISSGHRKKAEKQREVAEVTVQALERMMPKKILYREQNYGTPWRCPECEADQVRVEFFCEDGSKPEEKLTYCWGCGQRIDWGE